ncbi:MAG: cupin domain-containing protein [Methylocella sp.]
MNNRAPAPDNLFDLSGVYPGAEQSLTLVDAEGVKIERIVSSGQASPPGFWYDQDFAEWVLVLAGSAALRLDGEAADRVLRPGDHLFIAAHRKHRVEWTDAGAATIWLAVHLR